MTPIRDHIFVSGKSIKYFTTATTVYDGFHHEYTIGNEIGLQILSYTLKQAKNRQNDPYQGPPISGNK